MAIRRYDETRDLKAIERIWFECGWLENAEQAAYLKDFLSVGECLTATIGDAAECSVHTLPGSICYLDERLEMCAVTAVTTSRVGRKQGFAQQLTAQQIANAAGNGAEIATLGMFEQGFYDRLGFGTGSYEHRLVFDPATLIVDMPYRSPAPSPRVRRRGARECRPLPSGGSCRAEPGSLDTAQEPDPHVRERENDEPENHAPRRTRTPLMTQDALRDRHEVHQPRSAQPDRVPGPEALTGARTPRTRCRHKHRSGPRAP